MIVVCRYTKIVDNVLVGLILYVNDLLVFSKAESLITGVKDQLKKRFRMKDLGTINNYLGIAISYDQQARRMEPDQSEYIDSMVEKFSITNLRKYNIPMEKNLQLPFNTSCVPISDYRSLIGALLFVSTGTRPDVSFPTNYLSRFQTCATNLHFRYALRILKYLQLTRNLKLIFQSKEASAIDVWANADSAADSVDRKSTSSFLIRVFGSPVIWVTRKQSSVAQASTYAEYMALADAVTEVLPVIGVIKDLKVFNGNAIPVYKDNSGAVGLASCGKFTKRAKPKHIEVAYKFVSDYVSKGIISIIKVDSTEQLADILTKALGAVRLFHGVEEGYFYRIKVLLLVIFFQFFLPHPKICLVHPFIFFLNVLIIT